MFPHHRRSGRAELILNQIGNGLRCIEKILPRIFLEFAESLFDIADSVFVRGSSRSYTLNGQKSGFCFTPLYPLRLPFRLPFPSVAKKEKAKNQPLRSISPAASWLIPMLAV